MDLGTNLFTGQVPDTTNLLALQEMRVGNNKFSGLGPLGPSVVSFDGQNNKFTSIPSTWKSTPVETLIVQIRSQFRVDILLGQDVAYNV